MWKELIENVSGIELVEDMSKYVDVNTMGVVYSHVKDNPQVYMAICFNREMVDLIAEYMLGEPVNDQEEKIECIKEFANIVCGRLFGLIHKKTGKSIWFLPPKYVEGCNVDTSMKDDMVSFYYKNDGLGLVILLYDKKLELILEDRLEGLN